MSGVLKRVLMRHAVLLVTAFLLPQVMTKVLMCRFPTHSVLGTAAERFSGVPCARTVDVKLLVKTIITGCGSGTQEAGAHEPLWGKGKSLHLAGQWFLIVFGFTCLEPLVASLQRRKDRVARLEPASPLPWLSGSPSSWARLY